MKGTTKTEEMITGGLKEDGEGKEIRRSKNRGRCAKRLGRGRTVEPDKT